MKTLRKLYKNVSNDSLPYNLNESMIESLYYQFQLKLERLYLDIGQPCKIEIWWKRGKHKAISKGVHNQNKIQYIDLNDTLKTSVKCKFQGMRAVPFLTTIMVLLYPVTSNSCKQGGSIEDFDLTQILLPDNKKASVSKEFQLKLKNSPPNSKIHFTLTSKFLREAGIEESLADMSFQANSHAYNTQNSNQSQVNRSSADMTFRLTSNSEEGNKKLSKNRDPVQQIEQEQYLQSPLPRNQQMNRRSTEKRQEKRQRPSYRVEQKKEMNRVEEKKEPILGYSFGPVGNPEIQRLNREHLEQVNLLRRQLHEQKKQNERLMLLLKTRETQKNNVMDEKRLMQINQLNAAINQCDRFKQEKEDIMVQFNKLKEDYSRLREDIKQKEVMYGKAKEENREIAFNFNKVRDEVTDLSMKYESKKKELQQLKPKLDKIMRDNEEMKNELFRKQSELISNENQLEEVKVQYINKSIPIIEELKRVNQDLGRQRSELQKALNERNMNLQNEQKLRMEMNGKLQSSREEHEREKAKLIEYIKQKENEFHSHLAQIQQEMTNFMRDKESTIANLEAKNNQLQKKNQQLSNKIQEQAFKTANMSSQQVESFKIQISELKVKIKHHQEIYHKLQADFAEKQKEANSKTEFLQKVKEYVNKIEEESKEKDQAIRERDEFIAKAKEFITNKEAEMLTEIDKYKREVSFYKEKVDSYERQKSQAGRQNEKFIGEIVRESNQRQQRIEQLQSQLQEMNMILTELDWKVKEMQGYIDMQNQRFQTNMDEVQELNRKVKSQQQTLEELVKKNLDLEIQVNLKNFEISSIRGYK